MLAQIVRFGGVGLLATLSHVLTALAAERGLTFSPQGANFAGFAAAVVVSYIGHARVTFGVPLQSGPQIARFLVLALVGLAASSATVEIVVQVLGMGFGTAIALVAVAVPVANFLAMRFWVFSARRTNLPEAVGDTLVCMVIGCGLVAVYWGRLVNHDVAWFLFATRDWLGGAGLYTDLIEVNPPLAFYLTVPSLMIADATGVGDMQGHYVAVGILLVASLLWCAAILRADYNLLAWRRRLFAAWTGLAVLLVSSNGMGEREMMMVLFFLPWALSEAAPRRPTPGKAISTAGFAAVGMCLKPYFVLLPLAVTLLNCVNTRSLRPVLATANWVFGSVGLAFVVCVYVLHRAYFEETVPLAFGLYGAYGKPTVDATAAIALPLGTLVLWIALSWRHHSFSRPTLVFLSLAAASLASYFLQGTASVFHRIPFLAFSAMATGYALLHGGLARVPATAAGVVCIAIGAVGIDQGFYQSSALDEVREVTAGLGQIDGLTTLSPHLFNGPPIAFALETDWASTFPADWLVPGAINRLRHTDCAAQPETCAFLHAAAARNRSANIADLVRDQPDLLIVDRDSGYFEEDHFDWLAFMAEDPSWALAFAEYRPIAESRRFLYFLRKDHNEKTPP